MQFNFLMMHIVVIAEGHTQNELNEKGFNEGMEIQFVTNIDDAHKEADVIFYLADEKTLTQKTVDFSNFKCPVFVNAVVTTLKDLPSNCIRINAWSGFLLKPQLEICAGEVVQQKAEEILNQIGWKFLWTPDVQGLITPRTIAMIVNEAYFALEDEVSSKEEIDTAMKLGTNYPHGPFEWSEIIGLEKINHLLKTLAETDNRYIPSELLTTEIK